MTALSSVKAWARDLKRDVVALWIAARDPRVPWGAKLAAGAVAAYALSPIDLIPDFIPVLGYLDDLILIPLGIALVIRLIPAPVLADCRAEAGRVMAAGKPTNWIAAGVIIVLWLMLAALAVLGVRRLMR